MAHVEIFQANVPGRVQITSLGHDRERTDMGSPEFRIVVVMIIVRTPPDADRAEAEDSENPHDYFRERGMRQDRVVLLVVIEDEQTQKKQARENAANDPARDRNRGERPGNSGGEEASRRENMPPTRRREIGRERFRRQDKCFPCSWLAHLEDYAEKNCFVDHAGAHAPKFKVPRRDSWKCDRPSRERRRVKG